MAVACKLKARKGILCNILIKNDSQELYKITQMLARKKFTSHKSVRSKQGLLILKEEQQMKRWVSAEVLDLHIKAEISSLSKIAGAMKSLK